MVKTDRRISIAYQSEVTMIKLKGVCRIYEMGGGGGATGDMEGCNSKSKFIRHTVKTQFTSLFLVRNDAKIYLLKC